MESMGLCSVKTCGGNFAFDYVRRESVGADVFNSFIANAGLEEVTLGGSSFTWCYKSATKMSKLDRFLISKNLLITFPNISATNLDRYISDHRLILLCETQSDYGPVPFGFFHHWTELEGFNKNFIDTWSEALGDDSSAMRSMMRKLKYLKVKIQEWNNGNRNNTKRAIKKYKEELDALDAAIDKRNGSDDIVNKRIEVIKSMHHIQKIQAMDMAQKSKIKWSIEGDENSRFFHRMDLERDVSKEELKRAVWDCGTDKSPNPDGFTFGFHRCNSSFIALISKILDANLVKDFRPISLIRSIYKNIKKILVNRLVGVLGDIVNEVQSAFIAGRQILDGPFILNERVVDAGMFMGINLSPLLNLSHMFYADDAVFVGQWCDGNINTFVHVLECFYRALGLRIIMSKSKIMGVHVKDDKLTWKEVVDKVKYRLSNWKMKAWDDLCHGCQLGVPLSVLCMLESIHSYFFIGHELRSNKATWVKWNNVLASKEKGGLGVSSLYALNRGLMLKWV
nr:RNA-directed DNA polymerase, eukaryota [Tanacetum cinerariifolium]